MHTLIIVAMALFVNGTTGQQAVGYAQADDLIACAKVINDNRHPIPDANRDSLWYMTQAVCAVAEE